MHLSDVKARLSEIAEEVDRTHERVHVTRNGREYVVLLSAEDLESLEATIELLRDNSAMSRVREAEAAATADDLTTAEEMAKLMAERRVRVRYRINEANHHIVVLDVDLRLVAYRH